MAAAVVVAAAVALHPVHSPSRRRERCSCTTTKAIRDYLDPQHILHEPKIKKIRRKRRLSQVGDNEKEWRGCNLAILSTTQAFASSRRRCYLTFYEVESVGGPISDRETFTQAARSTRTLS